MVLTNRPAAAPRHRGDHQAVQSVGGIVDERRTIIAVGRRSRRARGRDRRGRRLRRRRRSRRSPCGSRSTHSRAGRISSRRANAQFQDRHHPGVNVNVQYQNWPDHLRKFDATLAAGTPPDVIEMGNTEMTKYMAAGAFQDLTLDKASFANSSTWLKGLAASGVYNGKTYGVPVLRGLARRHLPHRPVQEGRSRRSRRASRSSPPARRSSRAKHARRASRRSTSPARTGTSR